MVFILLNLFKAVSMDCQNVINLGIGMGLPSARPTVMNELKLDCCSATGVTCVGGRVTYIKWNNYGMTGFLNFTAVPDSTLTIFMDGNKLTGKFPSVWPASLVEIFIGGNNFGGTLPSAWPVGITMMNLDGNLFTGDVPLFPDTLKHLHLGFAGNINHLTGTLKLNQPTNLYINNNWITDVIINDISQLTTCDLSNNPLLGNVRIASLTMCTKNGLYSPSLLPITKSSTKVQSTWIGAFKSRSSSTLPISESGILAVQSTSTSIDASKSEFLFSLSISESGITANPMTTELNRVFLVIKPILSTIQILQIILRLFVDIFIFVLIVHFTPNRRELHKLFRKNNKLGIDYKLDGGIGRF